MSLKKGIAAMLNECVNMQPEETVLIVADTSTQKIGTAMWEVAVAGGAEAMVVIMVEREEHSGEPPGPIAGAMRAAQIVLAPTTKSLSSTRACREACAAGARVVSMPGITPGIITRSFAVDYASMRKLTRELAQQLSAADRAVLTTALGTALDVSLAGRRGLADTGDVSRPGILGQLPAGEAFITPLEGSCQGVFYCDASISGLGKVTVPLRCVVRDGRPVLLEGDKIGTLLQGMLEEAGGAVCGISGLGIGTNPNAPLSGNPLEDKKVFGTVHIRIGKIRRTKDDDPGDSPFHVDLIIKKPTLYLDEKMVIQEGRFV